MEWTDLKNLVDGWHQSASQIEGYQDTTLDGDGVQLMLFVKRTNDGDLELSVLSVLDWVSTLSPSQFLQAEDVASADEPKIPTASITVRQ